MQTRTSQRFQLRPELMAPAFEVYMPEPSNSPYFTYTCPIHGERSDTVSDPQCWDCLEIEHDEAEVRAQHITRICPLCGESHPCFTVAVPDNLACQHICPVM